MSTPAAAPTGGGMSVLSRLERLDLMLLCLEEIKAGRGSGRLSSGRSTASSGGDSGNSSASSSPKKKKKKKEYRNMEEVIMETQSKGSLIDRIILLESRLLKLEEIIENEKKEIQEINSPNKSSEKKKHKGLKSIVKSCVKGNLNTKD